MAELKLSDKISLTLRYPGTAVNEIKDRLKGVRGNNFPRLIDLFLTEACNFACPMCHVKESRQKNGQGGILPFETIKKVVEESKPYHASFQLIGGEPTLYPRTADVIDLLRRRRLVSSLTTNGLLLSRFAEEYVRNGLVFLSVSLDGWNEDSQFKRGRVPGSFAKIMEGVAKVRDLRGSGHFPIIRLATVITKHNFQNLRLIAEIAAAAGVDTWSMSHYYFITDEILERQRRFFAATGIGEDIWGDNIHEGGYFRKEEIAELEEVLASIRTRRWPMNIDYKWELDPVRFYSSADPNASSKCIVPDHHLFVRANGRMELCQGYSLGNAGEISIRDAWAGNEARYFRKVFKKNPLMPGCFRCCALDMKFD